MPQLYKYVGPEAIRHAVAESNSGVMIHDKNQLAFWMQQQDEWDDDCLTMTFAVPADGSLRVAPRRSEHVACARGADVLAAGELVIRLNPALEVVGASNLSTGYCPEPSCWEALQRALRSLDIPAPPALTFSCTFRKCPACGERNLVKDDWFVCAICDGPLPAEWNF